MAESPVIEPREISHYVQCLAFFFERGLEGIPEEKRDELLEAFQTAIFSGLIIGRIQPSLSEAATAYWNFTRKLTADQFAREMTNFYMKIRAKIQSD